MKQKGPAPTGAREQGGESNHPYNTTLWSLSQAIEGHLPPLIVIVERVVKVVMR